ncbi:MAG: metallophosphoesterase [Candidatus Sumerlaeaceae bacterium]|nr:metallophosphoesterase [Candidatus Sumerlaeaceae bacterium]
MSRVRFLQFSDCHLDSALAGSRLGFPPDKRARLNRDIEAALTRMVEIAREEQVEVVLCPGDLWDDESVAFTSATFLYDTFALLAPVPVLVAPGNHDPFNAFSYHNPAYYKSKAGRPHPRNVVVFGSPRLERRTVAALPDVDFYGCCFEANVPRTDRILAGVRQARPDMINILVLHGSRDDLVAGRGERALTAPFSRDELLAAGFDYAALGHYHRYSVIEDDSGRVRGAYAGVPVPRGLDETGDHGVLVGEIAEGGVVPGSLKRISVSPRRVLRLEVEVDASLLNAAAAQERISGAVAAAGASAEDILYITLTGRTHPDVTGFDFDPAWLDDLAFHAVVDQSRVEPDYNLDALLHDETACKRIEGQFAARMKRLLDEAAGDPARERLVRQALHLGLDALHGRELRPRHVC